MSLFARLTAALLALQLAVATPALAVDLSSSNWNELDGSNTVTPPSGWPAGMLPNQVEPTARAMMGATKRWYNHANATVTSGGTANAQTLSYAVAPAAYVAGDTYTFFVGSGLSNTGAATLNINSLGAVAVQFNGAALTGGEIPAGGFISVTYDGSNFQLVAAVPALGTVTSYPTAPVAGTNAQIDRSYEGGALVQTPSVLLGRSYGSGKTYARYSFSQELTSALLGGGTIANADAIFAYADVNGLGAPGVAIQAWAVARQTGDTAFSGNFVTSAPGNVTVQETGPEIDMQLVTGGAGTGTVCTGCYALPINVFGNNISGAIYINTLNGGSLSNGIIFGGDITGAGFAGASGATIGHLFDTGLATYSGSVAGVFENTHILEFAAASGTNIELYADASNIFHMALGSGGLAIVGSGGSVTVNSSGSLNVGGTTNSVGVYKSNGTLGVTSCSGTPSSSFAVAGGIVTHC